MRQDEAGNNIGNNDRLRFGNIRIYSRIRGDCRLNDYHNENQHSKQYEQCYLDDSEAGNRRRKGQGMKQLVVMSAMIALGLFLFGLIAGKGDNSILASLGMAWEKNIEIRSFYPSEDL